MSNIVRSALICTALIGATEALAETDNERAAALVAATPSANGAFYAQKDSVLHLPSGMLCEVKGDLDRRLRGLSVERDPDWGEVAACHYKIRIAGEDGNKKIDDRVALTFSVVAATPQNTHELRQRSRDVFLKRNPDWTFSRQPLEFKGKVQIGDESYAPFIHYFVASKDGAKMEAFMHIGVVRDWIVQIQLVGPDKETDLQYVLLSPYWTTLANRVIAMGELRKRQHIPTSAAPGQLEAR